MGMTIEQVIEHGKEQLEIFGGEHKEFIETSIETMRKYQKIEQIIDNWTRPEEIEWAIREVIDDGKID